MWVGFKINPTESVVIKTSAHVDLLCVWGMEGIDLITWFMILPSATCKAMCSQSITLKISPEDWNKSRYLSKGWVGEIEKSSLD